MEINANAIDNYRIGETNAEGWREELMEGHRDGYAGGHYYGP